MCIIKQLKYIVPVILLSACVYSEMKEKKDVEEYCEVHIGMLEHDEDTIYLFKFPSKSKYNQPVVSHVDLEQGKIDIRHYRKAANYAEIFDYDEDLGYKSRKEVYHHDTLKYYAEYNGHGDIIFRKVYLNEDDLLPFDTSFIEIYPDDDKLVAEEKYTVEITIPKVPAEYIRVSSSNGTILTRNKWKRDMESIQFNIEENTITLGKDEETNNHSAYVHNTGRFELRPRKPGKLTLIIQLSWDEKIIHYGEKTFEVVKLDSTDIIDLEEDFAL